MKFQLEIGGYKVLLSPDQIEKLTALLAGVEVAASKYVSPSGGKPSYYIPIIDTPPMTDILQLRVMDTESYEALKVVSKLQKEQE